MKHVASKPVKRDGSIWIASHCVGCHEKWPCKVGKALAVEPYRFETMAEMREALR